MSDRKDFFFGQQVTQAELDAAFDVAELADRDLVKDIIGFGFLVGVVNPATVEQAATPNLTVLVNQFLGYDQLGRRLANARHGYQGGANLGVDPQAVNMAVDEVSASTAVATPGNEKTLSIFVEFARHLGDQRTDANSATVYHDQQESVKFNVVQSAEAALGNSVPPPLRNNQLLLCDVVIVQGQTAILNADIDQSRRQGYAFSLLHGSQHVGNGSDPIPDADGVRSGLMPAADFTKLAGITFTAAGIAALFNCQASVFQPANIVAPATTAIDVTAAMAGKSAGGSASKPAVVTQTGAPNNRVAIFDEDMDDFLDAAGNKVYGRLTVDNETTPTSWVLTFYSFDETATETIFDMTPYAGATIKWFVTETFRLNNLPTFGKGFSIPSDQVAAEVPDATEATKGKVQLAADLEVSATKVPKANDTRLGGPQVRKGTGTTFQRARISLIEGAGISITVADDGGSNEVDVTIAATASGFMKSNGGSVAGSGSLSLAPSDGGAYTPKLALQIGAAAGFNSVGAAVSSTVEACYTDAGASSNVHSGDFIKTSGDTWNIVTFNSTTVQANHTVGASAYSGVWFLVGSN